MEAENEELYERIQLKETLLQKVTRRKLHLFRHICRIDRNRKIKDVLLGMIEETNKKGGPHREWLDDVKQWCQETLSTDSITAQVRDEWNNVVKKASSNYER